jgi:hypothetical protein
MVDLKSATSILVLPNIQTIQKNDVSQNVKKLGSRTLIAASLLLSFTFPSYSFANVKDYRNVEAVEKELLALSLKYPNRIKVETIGKSAGGRSLYFVQISKEGKVPANKRPALFVGANIAGFHHAGTEAAMNLIETLAASNDQKIDTLLSSKTIYVAPLLNPDAHNAMFAKTRFLRAGNETKIDKDLDGFIAEDGVDDLDGNGVITMMRIKDANGTMLVDPDNPRRMMKADPNKGERGNYRLMQEGKDDDNDGLYNEDGVEGIFPDRNFAAGFPVADAHAGRWPGLSPESKAIMDALVARKNIAMAVVYGPSNQLLTAPKGFERPTPAGAKPSNEANRIEADDLKVLATLGDSYKKSLEQAGLDNKRIGKQTGAGSFANWLYFHYGVQTIELDVWGVPKLKVIAKNNAANTDQTGKPVVGGMPNKDAAKDATKEATKDSTKDTNKDTDNEKDLYAYIDTNVPEAYTPWKAITLANGEKVEVGGLDPFAEYAPPAQLLAPAIAVHTDQIIALTGKLAQLEIIDTKVVSQGNDVWLITAVGGVQGELATHTKLATRMKNKIPVRLEMKLGKGVSSIVLNRAVVRERLEPAATIKGEWLVKGEKGSTVDIGLWAEQAGQVRTTVTLGKGN